MTTFSVFLAPLALLLPGASPPPHDAADPQLVEVGDDAAPVATLPPGWFALGAMLRPIANQVRIEQRVILRISPRAPEMQSMVSEMRRRAPNMHWEERKTGGCLPMTSLVGVRIGGEDQLVLYTRDRSMFRARLGDACSAREFYSGFYVEPNRDGKLCINRDRLQSRSGASCELSGLSRLVPVTD